MAFCFTATPTLILDFIITGSKRYKECSIYQNLVSQGTRIATCRQMFQADVPGRCSSRGRCSRHMYQADVNVSVDKPMVKSKGRSVFMLSIFNLCVLVSSCGANRPPVSPSISCIIFKCLRFYPYNNKMGQLGGTFGHAGGGICITPLPFLENS